MNGSALAALASALAVVSAACGQGPVVEHRSISVEEVQNSFGYAFQPGEEDFLPAVVQAWNTAPDSIKQNTCVGLRDYILNDGELLTEDDVEAEMKARADAARQPLGFAWAWQHTYMTACNW